MNLRLRFEETLIKVDFKKNEFDWVTQVIDYESNIRAKITYSGEGKIKTYNDYLGNWYDEKYFTTECPYNEYTIAESYWLLQNVTSSTIGFDMVELLPMELPNMGLFFMDVVYKNDEPETVIRKVVEYNDSKLFSDLVKEMSQYYNAKIIE